MGLNGKSQSVHQMSLPPPPRGVCIVLKQNGLFKGEFVSYRKHEERGYASVALAAGAGSQMPWEMVPQYVNHVNNYYVLVHSNGRDVVEG